MSAVMSERLKALPPYLLAEINRQKTVAIDAGRDVIDFGVGDPAEPTHTFIIDQMIAALPKPENHKYPLGGGSPGFRRAIAEFVSRRYGVMLDPATQVLALIGSKEGIGHLPLAVVNPGETVLVPSPGYPAYRAATIFAGGEPYTVPLVAERGWLPDLDAIPADVRSNAKLMFLNYPNNPTGAVAERPFFERAVAFARENSVILAHDAAYNDMWLDDFRPPSVLQVDGATDVAIEFHSASKTFNMTGWRTGFVIGNADVIAALARIKANVDSGLFFAIQETTAAAYARADCPEVEQMRQGYRRRAELLSGGLRDLGFTAEPPRATFYVWAGVPGGTDSMTVCRRLLDEADIVGVPGVGFGPTGEGYVRFSVSVSDERIELAVERMRKLKW